MSEVIYQSPTGVTPRWCIERQPAPITDPMVVEFRKWNRSRSLLNQNARWTATGWDPKRWTPKMPVVPIAIMNLVERHMQALDGDS